jgi:hypothetical protein
VAGSGCTIDTTNACLTTGTGQCCRSLTGQPGLCTQICTGGIAGSGCTIDTTNSCLGGTTGMQCCRSAVTGQSGLCLQVCTSGIVGQNCIIDNFNSCLGSGGIGPGGLEQCCRSRINRIVEGRCSAVCSQGPCIPLPSLCI